MLVIGRGPSVNEYNRNELKDCARRNFTFCVNDAAFDFKCDVVVALDPEWIKTNRDKLKKLNVPIITREWDCLKGLGLDLIELPNDIVEFARLSGMAAAKISDSMAKRMDMYSFVVGLDHTKMHYDRMETTCQPIPTICGLEAYKRLECHHTINLGEHSEITCWTKSIYLPKSDKPTPQDRLWGVLALKMCAKDWIRENIK